MEADGAGGGGGSSVETEGGGGGVGGAVGAEGAAAEEVAFGCREGFVGGVVFGEEVLHDLCFGCGVDSVKK